MSYTYYNLYCDESGIDGGGVYYLGAVYCSPLRARVLATRLADVRHRYGLTREMKWTRVSRSMLSAYKAFVDVFLRDPYSSFRIMEVIRGLHWRGFGQDEETRFFKSYYVFLRRNLKLQSRYSVYVDDKPGKRYRWSNVRYAVNGAIRRDYGASKQVRILVPLDSKSCNLLQVVDIVLGAAVSKATAPAKLELSRHVCESLAQPRYLGKAKLVRLAWTPQMVATRE